MKRTMAVFTIFILGCDAQQTTSTSKPREKTADERKADDLRMAYVRAGLSNVRCKPAVDGGVHYIGCRYDGDDAGSMLWYIDGPIIRAANGDAMSKVPKLGESWLAEAPRPPPPGIDIQKGLRLTK